MGCLAGFGAFGDPQIAYDEAGRNLPTRKKLSSFKVPHPYTFYSIKKVKNHDYVIFYGCNESTGIDRIMIFLDTKTLKPKYEVNYLLGEEITYPKKDELIISFPTNGIYTGYVINLKITPDKITQISKEKNPATLQEKIAKDKEFEKIGKKLYTFDNGDILYILNSEMRSISDKYLTLKDKNEKEIKKIEVPGDNLSYYCECIYDKYIAINVFNDATRVKTYDIYSIPDLNKICSFPVETPKKKQGLFTSTIFINNEKIILGYEGYINIGNIKTGKIEKSFVLDKVLSINSQHKLNDGTFVSVLTKGVVCHWKIDGTIISKTRAEACDIQAVSLLADDKKVVTQFIKQGEKRVNLESLDETQ